MALPDTLITVVDNAPLAGQDHHVASARAALSQRFVMTWEDRADDACGLNFDYKIDGGPIFVHHVTLLDDEFRVVPVIPGVSDAATAGFTVLDVNPCEVSSAGLCSFGLPSPTSAAPFTPSRQLRTSSSPSMVVAFFVSPSGLLPVATLVFFLALATVVNSSFVALSTRTSAASSLRMPTAPLCRRAVASCYSTPDIALLAPFLIVRCTLPLRRLLALANSALPPRTDIRCDD